VVVTPPPPIHRPQLVVAPPPPVHREVVVVKTVPESAVVITPRHPAVHPRILTVEPVVAPAPLVVVTAPPGHVQIPPGHAQIPPGHAKKEAEAAGRHIFVFTSQEREVIHTHFKHSTVTVVREGPGKGHKGTPPGLAKKARRGDNLPPEWEKRCVVGTVIPQEVYKQCEPLPQEVIIKLPPPPPDTIVVTIDAKVIRLARATLEILDVFDVL
jgi:hypothetical protein